MQRLERERRVADPRVAVVPVALPTRGLGQRRGQGSDRRACGHVRQPLDRERRALDQSAELVVGDASPRQPVTPEASRRAKQRVGLLDRCRRRRLVVPRERAEQRFALPEHVAGADVVGLDPEQQVRLEAHRLIAAGRVGAMAVRGQRPVREHAAVVESGLAHEFDLDGALDALDRPHEHVIGVLVGRRPRVRGDRVLAAAWPHRQRVVNLGPPRERFPRGHERVRSRLVVPAAGHVDPERAQAERARAAVQQRPEHAWRVEPREAQPVDRAVGGNERAGMAVRQKCVIGDRRERRRRRGAPRHRHDRAGGRRDLCHVAVALRALPGLGRAHDATHGPCQRP